MQIYTNQIVAKVDKGNLFIDKYKSMRITQILVTITNSIYSDFLNILIFVGVLVASVGTYATIRLWDSLHIIMYIASPAASLCCYIVAILMTAYADIPRQNALRFHFYWKRQLVMKIDRKKFQSFPNVIGFNVGSYGLATAALGIRICDDIVRNAVTLIILF